MWLYDSESAILCIARRSISSCAPDISTIDYIHEVNYDTHMQ